MATGYTQFINNKDFDFEKWIKNKELSGIVIDIKVWLGYYVIVAKLFKGSLDID